VVPSAAGAYLGASVGGRNLTYASLASSAAAAPNAIHALYQRVSPRAASNLYIDITPLSESFSVSELLATPMSVAQGSDVFVYGLNVINDVVSGQNPTLVGGFQSTGEEFAFPFWQGFEQVGVCPIFVGQGYPQCYPVDGSGNYLLFRTQVGNPSRFCIVPCDLDGNEGLRSFIILDDPHYDAILQTATTFPRLCGAGFCCAAVTPTNDPCLIVIAPNGLSYIVIELTAPDDAVANAYLHAAGFQFVNDRLFYVDTVGDVWLSPFSTNPTPFTNSARLDMAFSSAVPQGVVIPPSWRADCRPCLPVANGTR